MKLRHDLNDTLRTEGVDVVRARMDASKPYTPKQTSMRIELVPFAEVGLGTDRRYAIKNLIPREGLTTVWGPPKSGKSFKVFDMCMHVALGWAYHQRRVHQGPVVYCAFEGQGGIRARVAAFRRHHNVVAAPFYLQMLRLDLIKDSGELIEAIRAKLDKQPPVIVTLDTLNRSLVGSESSDEDMAAYIAAAEDIRAAFDCGVIIVHHCGINETRPRGHTSLTGAADAQIAVKRNDDGIITATVEWMKDGEGEGDVIASRLLSVTVGLDEDDDLITSCVIEPAEVPATTGKGVGKVSRDAETMFTLLELAGKDGLSTEDWNTKARENGIGEKRRADLVDAREALRKKKRIHTYADRWYVSHK